MPGNGRVLVTFLPRYKFFGKIFPSLNFTLATLPLHLFIGSQPTLLCLNFLCLNHSLGKTEQVIFLNACKITTVIQTTDNNCEGTRSGRRANACVT